MHVLLTSVFISLGAISLLQNLDYETQKQYIYAITAKLSTPLREHIAFASVVINVINTNDNTPRVENMISAVNISENHAVGAEVVRIQAIDEDNDNLVYNLYNADVYFDITSEGVVVLTSPVDYFRTKNSFVLTVMVSDSIFAVNATVHVDVILAPKPPPTFTQVLYTLTVVDTIEVGDAVMNFRLTQDYPPNTFTIENAEGSDLFSISSAGVMTLAKKLTHDNLRQYILTVTVKDQRSTGSAAVIVNIKQGSCPMMSQPKTLSISQLAKENVYVMPVGGYHPSAALTYDLVHSEDNVFKVDQKGMIRTAKDLLYVTLKDYQVTVSVTANNCSRNASNIIRVEAAPNCPNCNNYEFSSPYYELEIDEGVVPPSHVLSLSIGINISVTYYINDTKAAEYVKVDNKTGALSVIKAFDYESVQSLAFDVTASATNQGVMYQKRDYKRSCKVHIKVIDQDDNCPQFSSSKYITSVSAPVLQGTIVYSVSATDVDSLKNLRYSLISDVFEVDNHGVIRAKKLIPNDFNDKLFNLDVTVMDSLCTRTTQVAVKVRIVVDIIHLMRSAFFAFFFFVHFHHFH